MIHLLRLELIKMKRSRYTYVLLAILLTAVGSYYFYVNQKDMGLYEAQAMIAESLDSHQQAYEQAMKEIEEVEKREGMVDYVLQNFLEVTKRQFEAHQMMFEGVTNHDWSLYWQGEIMNTLRMEENKKEELQTIVKSYRWPTPFTVLSTMEQVRWMEENSIQPVFPTNYASWHSLYDEEYDSPLIKDLVTDAAEKYSSSGFFFIYYLFGYGFGLLGLFFVLFLFTDILTKEGFGKNGPIQMLRTQPIRKSMFWISKWLTVMGGSLLLVFLITMTGLGLGGFFNRLGDWNYPVLIYGPERTYTFLTMTEFLFRGLGLFLLILALGFSLLFLFSVLTNRAVLAIGLTVAVIILGQMLTEQASLLTWSHWLPFHYFEVYPILNGEYAVINENELFTYRQAMLSLSICTLIVLVATFGAVKLRKGVMS